MTTYLLTWNPRRFNTWYELEGLSHGSVMSWSCGSKKAIEEGSRIFLMKQGSDPRGIVASGRTVSEVYQWRHWDAARRKKGIKANCVDVRFDVILSEDANYVLPVSALKRGATRKVHWRTQMSGIEIPATAVKHLEKIWATFAKLGKAVVQHTRKRVLENTLTEVTHYRRSRDRSLRDEALRAARGVCEACKVEYGRLFGGIGLRVLQVHHRRQLAATAAPRLTSVDDLAVVCANCHAMIHADPKRAMSIQELRKKLRAAR